MELNNTIILPGDNAELSQKLLMSLIQKEDVITVVIFGRDQQAEAAVQKADIRASAIVSGISRKVAWMQDVSLLGYLKTITKQSSKYKPDDINIGKHLGVAISMTDTIKDLIPLNPAPDFIRFEMAFMEAGTFN